MSTGSFCLGIAKARVRSGHLMCTSSRRGGGHAEVVAQYLAAGLANGEMSVAVVDRGTAAQVRRRLETLGVDVKTASRRHQLRLADHARTYLRTGLFDGGDMIKMVRQLCEEADLAGWNGLRAYGDVTPLLGDEVVETKVIEFEALLNNLDHQRLNLFFCGYDTEQVKSDVLDLARATHPTIVDDRGVLHNQRYLPPVKLLRRLYCYRPANIVSDLPVTHDEAARTGREVALLAAKSPLSLRQVLDLQKAVELALAQLGGGSAGPGRIACRSNSSSARVTITIAARPASSERIAEQAREAVARYVPDALVRETPAGSVLVLVQRPGGCAPRL